MTKLDAASAGWIVAAALVINTSAQAFVFAVLPTVGRGIGLSELQTGAILGLGALLGMLVGPFWGFASERFGRRPVLLATMAGVVAHPLLWALALGATASVLPLMATFAFLLGARCFQAGFGAGLIPTAQAYFADVTTPGKRTAGMGMMSGSISLGTVAGSALVWAVCGLRHDLRVRGPGDARRGDAVPRPHAPAGTPRGPKRSSATPTRFRSQTVWPYFVVTALGMTAYGMVQPITGLRLIDQFGLANAGAIGQAGAVLTGTALADAVLAVGARRAPRLAAAPHADRRRARRPCRHRHARDHHRLPGCSSAR